MHVFITSVIFLGPFSGPIAKVSAVLFYFVVNLSIETIRARINYFWEFTINNTVFKSITNFRARLLKWAQKTGPKKTE